MAARVSLDSGPERVWAVCAQDAKRDMRSALSRSALVSELRAKKARAGCSHSLPAACSFHYGEAHSHMWLRLAEIPMKTPCLRHAWACRLG